MSIESRGRSYGGMHGGGPGKDPVRSEWDMMSYEKQAVWKAANYAPLQQAMLKKWREGLTQDELDAITPWSLLPIDRMIKLGFVNLRKKLLKR